MIIRAISVVAAIALLTACAKAVWVQKNSESATAAGVYGLPFYVKTEQFKKTTVYADTWLRSTLTVAKKLVDTKDGKEVLLDRGTQQYVKDLPKPQPDALVDIKSSILRSDNADLAEAERVIQSFMRLKEVDHAKTTGWVLIKNVVESEWVVDNSRTYYLNAPIPWFGSGSLTQKLNADGTLSEVVSTPDTKLSEGLSSLIPLKEYLTGEYVKAAPAAAAEDNKDADIKKGMVEFLRVNPRSRVADKAYVYILSLQIEEIGHEYTLTSQPVPQRPADLAPLTLSDVGKAEAQFSRKDIGSEKEDKKEEGPTVGVSGSITFPKGWGSSKPEESTED